MLKHTTAGFALQQCLQQLLQAQSCLDMHRRHAVDSVAGECNFTRLCLVLAVGLPALGSREVQLPEGSSAGGPLPV